MRGVIWTILGIAILAAAPARGQTYDPRYPVCLQAYGWKGDYIDCSYTSLAQCRATASGRAAECYANPYFSHAYAERPGQAYRRQRHVRE